MRFHTLFAAPLLASAALAASGCATCARDDAMRPGVVHAVDSAVLPQTPAAPTSGIDLLWPNGEGGEPCVIP